jgi:glycosyltransferase involved in cell wall biosynthesis
VAGARPRRLRLLGQFLREQRRSPFDVIHARWAAPPGVLAAILGRAFGIPVLLRLTGGDLASIPEIGYGQRRTWRGRLWLRLAVWGASHITVPSASMQRSAEALGIRAERLPWGVATDRWPPLAPRPRDANRPARLVWVGTLNRVKNPEMLLRTAQILRARGLPFRLDVIGEDTRGGEIQRMAGELGLEDCVRFRGFLTQTELRAELAEADLLLVTSWHEADPVVLFEAASAGVPAAGAAVGHLADWAPEAAWAVPVDDAEALADAVSMALSDDGMRLKVAEAARRRALEEDCDHCVRRLNEIYREMAGRK